jgi:hypothetical protein
MKTNEELLEIIHDNEFILPADSNARFVFLDKEQDEVIVELNVLLGSPYVSIEGEIINPNYQQVRKSLRLKLKLSDLFILAPKQEPPLRDVNYTMTKLEEALKHQCSWATGKHDEECDMVAGLTAAYNERGARLLKISGQLDMANQRVKDFEDDYKLVMEEKCGEDDRLHCSCVPSLRAAVKEARQEMFDLYHQACCVEISQDGTYARYDNQCMSCYEYAEEKLIEWGLLKPEQCLRRPLPLETKPSELGPDYVKVELPFPVKQISIDLLKDAELKIPVSPTPVTPEWADEEKKK